MWERELGHSELRRPCPQPPSSFYIRAVRQGPKPSVGWRPRSGCEIERGLGLGPIPLDACWGQSNILSLDINLILILLLNLIIKLSTHFIIDQYIEQLCYNSQLRTTRLNNYHATFHFEIYSHLILEPLVSKNHRLSLNPMMATCSLNTLSGKPFINDP
jgi:hypothetical protein